MALSLLAVMPAVAKDREAAADTQLMISLNHFFGQADAQASQVRFFTMATFMYDLPKDWPIMFGYGGPVFSNGKWNLYTMAVGMNNPIGWSIGPSVWLEYNGANYLLIEGDYYVPLLAASHDEDALAPVHAYYGFGEYARNLNGKVTLGADWEIFGSIDQTRLAELAYGPFVKVDRLKVWAFRDETPNLPGMNYYGVRFKFCL
jgi:hypothetical protein